MYLYRYRWFYSMENSLINAHIHKNSLSISFTRLFYTARSLENDNLPSIFCRRPDFRRVD